MRRHLAALVSLFVLASGAAAEDRAFRPGVPTTTPEAVPVRRLVTDPPNSRLDVGDRAPQFSYLAMDDEWHQASELFARGPVVLVFGADRDEMRAIERERTRFLETGMTPVLVMDMKAGSIGRLARRLALSGPIVSDPRGAIADLYNSVDRNSLRHAPAFFVVDEHRKIRALRHGDLPSPTVLLAFSAKSLGRDLPAPSASKN
jgi:peroxiredoxin